MESAWGHLLDTPLEDFALTFVDVETTGLSARFGDRICEIAAIRYRGHSEIDRMVTLVNPKRPISPGAEAVNGITSEMVAAAPTFAAVAPTLLGFFEDGAIVAHNAPFDLSFLSRELDMAGQPVPRHLPVIDTLSLARRCFVFPSNSLARIASSLGISGVEHRALADAMTTREVLSHFVAEIGGGLPVSIGRMLALQGGSIAWPAAVAVDETLVPAELSDALAAGTSLYLSYVSAQGVRSERRVDPIEVVTRGTTVYLLAFCHLRQEQRTFRLDRIVSWSSG